MSGVIFITLGPEGSCHENAVRRYAEFQELPDTHIVFIEDWMVGLELLRESEHAFLVQCSAHPTVHTVTETYYREVFVVDTFLYPTQELALLRRAAVKEPRTLGLVEATSAYIDTTGYEITWEASKPIVGRRLLEGAYDAGLTYTRLARSHPDELVVEQEIGAVDTAWLVYGRRKRFRGDLIAVRSPEVFEAAVSAR